MHWTFTTFEHPQTLNKIMRKAWRMIKSYSPHAFAKALRFAWALARKKAGVKLPLRPLTLAQFLHNKGGLKPCDELRQIGTPLYLLMRYGSGLDDAARAATEAGYAVQGCTSRLLDMLHDEFFGIDHLAECDIATALELDEWDTYHNQLMEDGTMKNLTTEYGLACPECGKCDFESRVLNFHIIPEKPIS